MAASTAGMSLSNSTEREVNIMVLDRISWKALFIMLGVLVILRIVLAL